MKKKVKDKAKETSKKSGMAPGSMVHIGKVFGGSGVSMINYSEKKFEEIQVRKIEECLKKDSSVITWINIDGLHNIDLIDRLGTGFGMHPLILEDIVDTEQRPKAEVFENYIFVVLKMFNYSDVLNEIESEQISIVFGKNFVISFQEKEGDVFNPVRKRLEEGKTRIRKNKADFLAYSLMDAIVDNYFMVLEKIGERIEYLEEAVVKEPTPKTLQEINSLKEELNYLRRSVWPLREVVNSLERTESSLIESSTKTYLRDVYDHTIQVIDSVETSREMVSGMIDIYLSSVSNKMNEVMKVLTIIATIFIPLTFITGLYGMNFDVMPELRHEYGYFSVLALMLVIAVIMVMFFRRKQWL